jgi:hypothetical protein
MYNLVNGWMRHHYSSDLIKVVFFTVFPAFSAFFIVEKLFEEKSEVNFYGKI